MKKKVVAVIGMTVVAAFVAQGALINIQFAGTTWNDPDIMSGAAVVGSAGDTWNQGWRPYDQTSGTEALVDSTGAATGASVSWTTWLMLTAMEGGNDCFAGTVYEPFMRGYLAAQSGVEKTITISGLAASSACTVYAYTQGDSASSGRRLSLSLNGGAAVVTAATDATASTFIENQNYVQLVGTTDATGTLTVAWMGSGTEGNLNGLQVVTDVVPEPATAGLLGISAIVFYAIRRIKNFNRLV